MSDGTEAPRARKIRTAAGFGKAEPVALRIRLQRRWQNFHAKNAGLLANPAFWRLLPRLIAGRVRPSPLAAGGPILFVSTHHKVMTTYFHAVLRLFAFGLRIPFDKVHIESPARGTRLFLSMQSKMDLAALGSWRGVHVMRDPRDMIVSSYHYHKWTHEEWAHRPDKNGLSYQQKLNAADKRKGLYMEIDHFIFSYKNLLDNWDLTDPAMLEVAYEDLMGPDRAAVYTRIFTHLGFSGRALALGQDLMRLFEAESRTGVSKDAASSIDGAHIRSGKSGQWQDELEPDHLAYIEQELGPILRKFGYS
jgi:hypothetical protein